MKSSLNSSAWTVAIDTGNTFTHACMFREGSDHIFTGKVPSCPDDPSRPVMEALSGLCQKAGVSPDYLSYIIGGNSLALNSITRIQETKTALLVTRGFRDIIYINTLKPFVERRLIFEVPERMLSGGQVHFPLNENELRFKIVPQLAKNQIESVAVCFLHSCDNSLHENMVKAIIKEMLPSVSVTVSSDITPFPGESSRAVTALANAAVSPLAGKYIENTIKIFSGLTKSIPGHWVMQSDGSVMSPRQALDQSIRTLLSSPAGGITSCAILARHTGRPNIITFEMGGTYSSFSILSKNSRKVQEGGLVYGYPLAISMYDINTTMAGGSSIARVDDRGSLMLGTESAGVIPGPACFDRGGKLPTCTDANLILGRIGPETFYSGGIPLNPDTAREAIGHHIAGPLDISVESAAQSIIKAANSILIRAARRMAAENGCDPREFTLASFGGCGPLHAAEVALELGIPNVLVPIYPGFHSALGMLFTDLRRNYRYNCLLLLNKTDPEVLDSKYLGLEEKARDEYGKQYPSANITITRSADIRYKGQSHVINMQVPSGKLIPADLTLLKRAFDVTCENESGLSTDQSEVEIVALRVLAITSNHDREGLFYRKKEVSGTQLPNPGEIRPLIFGQDQINTPVYNRKDLPPNTVLIGPAVVEQDDATTLIWPRMTASVDLYGNIIIDVGVK